MLFTDINQVKDYIPLNTEQDIAKVKPHLKRAEQKYIKTYLGNELYQTIHDYVNDTTEGKTSDDALDALLPYVLNPLALFAYKDAIPQLNVVATSTGFAIIQNANLVPASKQRTDELRDSQEEAAWDAIESLLEFLEENKADYDDWVDSTAYSLAQRNLINSAMEFTRFANINTSRLAFMRLRAVMDNVENITIADSISIELLTAIKNELKDDDLSNENKVIIENLQRALANLSIADQKIQPDKDATNIYAVFTIADDIREQFRKTGMNYLSKVLDIIKKTPDDYPAYKDSDKYTADTTNTPFENTQESSIFVFGG
jgi:hypothetical protein